MRKKILLVVNNDWFFLSHRKDVAVGALNAGYDVTIVTRNNGHFDAIHSLGLKTIELQMNPTGMNPVEELKTLWFLIKLYKREKPDIVHQVGPKVNLWGTLAARIAGVPAVVNAVSGLGVIFDGKSTISKFMPTLYKWIHRGKKNLQVIFQNDEDKGIYLKNGIVKEKQCRFIMGSGINLDEYVYTPEPEFGRIKLLFTARMIKEKGVYQIIEAAHSLYTDYKGKIQFVLCGGLAEEGRTNYIPEEDLHPFEDTIKKQHEAGRYEHLFADKRMTPTYELQTLKAVQSIAGNKPAEFDNWFQALDWMKSEIDKRDFDIAIIGCGAYGFPLAAHVKQIGKKAVHLGGAVQNLFGIDSLAMRDDDRKKSLVNAYWIYPSAEETPKNIELVENGRYW